MGVVIQRLLSSSLLSSSLRLHSCRLHTDTSIVWQLSAECRFSKTFLRVLTRVLKCLPISNSLPLAILMNPD